MRITGPGKRLTVYIGESDQWQGKPLYRALLELLKREGFAGATVMRGVAGFGAHSRIHMASIEQLSTDLPLVMEIVDQPERIDRALALLGPMVREGLITVEDVFIARYTHRYLHPIPGDLMVRDVMTASVMTVEPDAPIAEVMDLLIGQRFKCLPVVEGDRQVLGIIGDGALIAHAGMPFHLSIAERLSKDAIAATLAEARRSKTTARDVMTSPVKTVAADCSLAHAASMMAENHLQRLPVVDSAGRLAGMLSRLDVLRTVVPPSTHSHAPAIPIGDAGAVGAVMDPDVPTVPLDADLADIVEKMVASDLKRVVVVDSEGKALGIINDGDLVARVDEDARPAVIRLLMRRGKDATLPNRTAAELMTPFVLTGLANTPIVEAVQAMLAQKRKRFIVVDDAGRPVGIVDRQMLLHAMVGSTNGKG
jgi:CBS domain-containing protein